MLNAMEPEVDVEGLTGANKLDYDSPDASWLYIADFLS